MSRRPEREYSGAALRAKAMPPAFEVEASTRPEAGTPESIAALAAEFSAAGETARRIVVIGVSHKVGATTTAIALARSLAKQGRVVLVDLALGAPDLASIASDPAAPGIAELVGGSASFGQIITRDRHSRVHLIMAGRSEMDDQAIMGSHRLAITLEALGRTYDHVVIDAGVAGNAALERLAPGVQRVVLVAGDQDAQTSAAAERMLYDAGFSNVTMLASGDAVVRDQAAA